MMLKSLKLAMTIAVITTDVFGAESTDGGAGNRGPTQDGTAVQKKGPSSALFWGSHLGISLWSILTIGIFAIVIFSGIQSMPSGVGGEDQFGFLETFSQTVCPHATWALPAGLMVLGLCSSVLLCLTRHGVSNQYDNSYTPAGKDAKLGGKKRMKVNMQYSCGFAFLLIGAFYFTFGSFCGGTAAKAAVAFSFSITGIILLLIRPVVVGYKWCRHGRQGWMKDYPKTVSKSDNNNNGIRIVDEIVQKKSSWPPIPGDKDLVPSKAIPTDNNTGQESKVEADRACPTQLSKLPAIKDGVSYILEPNEHHISPELMEPTVLRRRRLSPTLTKILLSTN